MIIPIIKASSFNNRERVEIPANYIDRIEPLSNGVSIHVGVKSYFINSDDWVKCQSLIDFSNSSSK